MMKRKLLKSLLIIFLLLVVSVATVIILYTYTPVIDNAILRVVNNLAGDDVKIRYDRIEGNLLGHVRIINVKIEFQNIQITCPQIIIHHSSGELINQNIDIQSLLIDSPTILVEQSVTPEGDSGDNSTAVLAQIHPDSLDINIDLTGLPDIRIRKLILKEGSVVISRENRKIAQVADISMEISANINEENVEINTKYIKGFWQEKDIRVNQLSFRLIGNKKRLTLNQFISKIDKNEIYAHGEIELFPKLRFLLFADTSRIDLELVNKIAPDFPYKEGYLRFYIEYIGIPSHFQGNMYVSGKLDSLSFRRIHAKYRYQNRTLELSDLIASTNFGTVGGGLTVAPEGRNNISLYFNKLNFKKPSIVPVETNVDGWIRLDFNTWDLSNITGQGKSQFTGIHYGDIRMDTLFLLLDVDDGFWHLREGSRLVVEKNSKFFVQGDMSKNRMLNLNLTTDRNVLDTLSRRLAFGPIGGVGHLKLQVGGHLYNPDVSGLVLLDSLVVENQKSYGVEGEFEIRGVAQERNGFFNLEMASGNVLDIYLTDGVVDLTINYNSILIDSVSFYNEDNYVTLKGSVGLLEKYLDISLFDFIFQYQDYRIFSEDTLIAFYQNDSLIIEDFVLNATGDGEIEVRGLYDFEGESGLGVYFKDIQMLPFNQFIQLEYPMRGVMDISIIVSGYPDSLSVEGLMEMQNFVLGMDTIGNVAGNFNYTTDQIEIEKFELIHSADSYLTVSGNLSFPRKKPGSTGVKIVTDERINVALNFKNIRLKDYPYFSKINYPFDGIFSGEIDVRGTMQNFRGSYSLNARDLRYKDYEFYSIDLDGSLFPEGLVLERGDINFLGTVIKVSGQKALQWDYQNLKDIFSDKSFDLKITIRDDSLAFLNVLTPETDLLTGDVNIYLNIGGSIDAPTLKNGLLEISDGTLYLSKVENPFTDVQFSAAVDDGILKIKKCNAKTSGYVQETGFLGSVTDVLLYPIRRLFLSQQSRNELAIGGKIDLRNLTKPDLDLTLTANQIYINYFLENAELLLSVNDMTISGTDTISIEGNVVIHKGEVDLDLEESEKNLLLTSNVRETKPYLRYQLGISIPGNFYIRSEALFNSFDMMLMGDLQIIQEPKSLLEMYGNLEVPKGKYFQFEEFRIRNGRIEFINPKELPKLNIFAEKNKYGYLFQLHVEGSLNNPIKEIRIYDPNTREDITHLYPETKDQIALLLFGMTFNEIGGSAGSVALGKGQEVINEAIISKIEQEARRFIGVDEIRVESEGGLIDFTNLRLNQMSKNSAISLGKYLMPNLYVEYKTQLGGSGVSTLGDASAPKLDYEVGNQVYLEYRINRNWSVSSFYAKQLYDKFKIDISWRYTF